MTTAALTFWTIGHSNHSLDYFLELLLQNQITLLVDIRRFPGSRKFPHFQRENLQRSIEQAGIAYQWLEGLGGRRGKSSTTTPSPNEGLHNQSFRNYADYMLTEAFRQSFAQLATWAATSRTVIMCSESVFWRCHRRLVSDYAVASGGTVFHLFPDGRQRPHELTAGAKVQEQDEALRLVYPGEPSLF